MEKEEFEGLKIGDHVWKFEIDFSTTGKIIMNLIAELEVIKKEYQSQQYIGFNIVKVECGTSLREGMKINYGSNQYYHVSRLFKNYNEGVDYWNSAIRNEEDRITSVYQDRVKKLQRKLKKKRSCCG